MSRFSSFRLIVGAAVAFALVAMKAPDMPPAALLNQSPTPTPDTYGYKWIDNQGTDAPPGGQGPDFTALWTNISTSGTALTALATDDGVTSFNPPMLVRYYGQNWGQAPTGSTVTVVSPTVWVSTNNNVQFLNTGQTASTSYTNGALPASGMNGLVGIFWDDGYGASAGNTCRWQVIGTAPNRRLVVQWTSWDFCCGDGPNMEFAVHFTESDGTFDSTIYYLYNDITSTDPRETGNSATIGIQSPSLNSSLTYALNSQTAVATGRAIRFYTNQPPNPPTGLSQASDSGGPSRPLGFVSDATAYFRGVGTDPDTTNTVGMQVEILPAATPFQTAVTGELTSVGALVAQGAQAECVYTFDGTPYGSGDYHWRMRTVDQAGGASAWVVFNAATVHLTVDLVPPSVPGGPYRPEELDSVGVAPAGSDVLFQWGFASDVGPPGPMSYRLQVSASPGFPVSLADETLAAQEYSVVMQISAAPYYWRVAAIDQAGNQGPFTVPISFFVSFNDTVDHGGGDCTISAGSIPGPLIPAAMAALLLAYGWTRRRRLP